MAMTDYPIRVLGGLPALARIHSYRPFVPSTWHAPAEGPEVDWELLDAKGRRALWIERRLTPAQLEEIEHELLDRCSTAYRSRLDDDL
jgi:hypothetical protein